MSVLDTPAEPGFDDLVRLASRICKAPLALVSLVDAERQWFKARLGLDISETPRDVAFCAHAILRPGEVLHVPDATRDARFADNPGVTAIPGIRFYAGVPLVTGEGHALGTLCVADRSVRALDEEQLDALRVLGRQVVAQLELRRQLRSLSRLVIDEQARHQDTDRRPTRARWAPRRASSPAPPRCCACSAPRAACCAPTRPSSPTSASAPTGTSAATWTTTTRTRSRSPTCWRACAPASTCAASARACAPPTAPCARW